MKKLFVFPLFFFLFSVAAFSADSHPPRTVYFGYSGVKPLSEKTKQQLETELAKLSLQVKWQGSAEAKQSDVIVAVYVWENSYPDWAKGCALPEGGFQQWLECASISSNPAVGNRIHVRLDLLKAGLERDGFPAWGETLDVGLARLILHGFGHVVRRDGWHADYADIMSAEFSYKANYGRFTPQTIGELSRRLAVWPPQMQDVSR